LKTIPRKAAAAMRQNCFGEDRFMSFGSFGTDSLGLGCSSFNAGFCDEVVFLRGEKRQDSFMEAVSPSTFQSDARSDKASSPDALPT
jgi:hypothetical protein